jgi:hypothetical protein
MSRHVLLERCAPVKLFRLGGIRNCVVLTTGQRTLITDGQLLWLERPRRDELVTKLFMTTLASHSYKLGIRDPNRGN